MLLTIRIKGVLGDEWLVRLASGWEDGGLMGFNLKHVQTETNKCTEDILVISHDGSLNLFCVKLMS